MLALPHRFTSIKKYLRNLIDFDSGYFHTLFYLFVHPGILVGDYLNGKTKPYNNPVRFLFNTVSLVVITELIRVAIGSYVSGQPFDWSKVTDQLTLIVNPITLAAIIFTPGFNYFFFRSNLNLAEHAIIGLFQVSKYFYIAVVVMQVWYFVMGYEPWLYTLFAALMTGITVRYHLSVFGRARIPRSVMTSLAYVMASLTGIFLFIVISSMLGR
jgi:hypothetical protein